MAERYEVRASHGKGVFSTVLLAKDRSQAADSPLGMVAIKVLSQTCPLYLHCALCIVHVHVHASCHHPM